MARVELTRAAAADVADAARWYATHDRDLAESFVFAVRRARSRLQEHPRVGPVVHRGVRRMVVGRFPYGIFYRYDDASDLVTVVAITHLHRAPSTWKGRT